MVKKLKFYVLIFVLLSACTTEQTPYFNKELRTQVDTLYKNQLEDLKKETDSLCEVQTQKILETAVDSIIQVRLEERKKKLGY